MKTQTVNVRRVKKGSKLSTSTGMREVLDVADRAMFVTITVSDPANPRGGFKTALDYCPDSTVQVSR